MSSCNLYISLHLTASCWQEVIRERALCRELEARVEGVLEVGSTCTVLTSDDELSAKS